MLTVTLFTDELLHDIHTRSHNECLAIADAQERYRVEAGTEKTDYLVREMMTVQSSLKRMMRRWLVDSSLSAGNTLDMPESFDFVLNMTGRRADNKVQPLTDACHNYMVTYTMARYYASVGMKDLSNTYSLLTVDHAKEVEELINAKMPPL